MNDQLDLIAELREDQGKGASRRLRRQGKIPAIIYGGGRPPRAISLDHNKVQQQLEHEAFYSSVLTIKVGEKIQPAILKDLQRHPARRQILHMDLQRIVAGEKIRMQVPIHFVGEESSLGVKQGGSVSRLMTEVEVSCLPKDLPGYIDVDISGMDLDDMLYLSDIKTPEGVELTELAYGEEHDHAIVSIHIIRAAPVEEEAAEEEAAEPEAAEPGEAEPEVPEEGGGESKD